MIYINDLNSWTWINRHGHQQIHGARRPRPGSFWTGGWSDGWSPWKHECRCSWDLVGIRNQPRQKSPGNVRRSNKKWLGLAASGWFAMPSLRRILSYTMIYHVLVGNLPYLECTQVSCQFYTSKSQWKWDLNEQMGHGISDQVSWKRSGKFMVTRRIV